MATVMAGEVGFAPTLVWAVSLGRKMRIIKFILAGFSTPSKPEDQFFIRLPEAIIKADRIAVLGRGSWRRHTTEQEKTENWLNMIFEFISALLNIRSCLAGLFQSTLGYVQLAAVISTMIISSLRLKRQDYVDPIYQHSYDHKNIRWSLNIFYALALSQSIVYFLTVIMASPLVRIVQVSKRYKIVIWGLLPLARYVEECFLKCVNGNLRGAVSMDLVSFAKELVSSDSIDNQLMGFRILDHLLRSKYKWRVLKKIRASIGTIQMAVHMLSLKIGKDTDTRGHAACVLLELAPDLQVESFPGILPAVSSLLSTNKGATNSESCSNPITVMKEFKLLGVQILEKLVDDQDNCTQVKDAKGLIPKIIELTREGRLDCKLDFEIVHSSLKALLKLVSTTGEAGEELRRQVSGNFHIMEVIKKILTDRTEGQQADLLVQATGILAFLAVDDIGRKEIRSSRLIVRMLISFLEGEMNAVQDPIPRKVMESLVTEALVLLTTPFEEKIVVSTVSESSVQAMLAEATVQDMENIVHVLTNESADHRTGVGKLLQNLRAYQGAEYTELFKIIDKALPKVLETIDLAVGKFESDSSDEHPSHAQELIESAEDKGKLLESFIGLTVQICTNGDEMVFTDALRTANITVDEFVLKLKMILTVYKSPTAYFPGVRRVVIQQINWMMNKNPAYIVVFKKHEMDMILKETAETATKLENFLLFHSGVGAFEHEESISSIRSGEG
uniref:BLE2 protein n=1 Tax=Oryza punctata TaxID=4537 RepID=A0A0E0JJM5_ORYPU